MTENYFPISLKAELNLCDEFFTKKSNFIKLSNELRKKGYKVDEVIKESMGSIEKQEISLILNGKEIKIFTSSDPYAKDAIIDSDLLRRMPEIIEKIENLVKIKQ